VEEIPAAGFEAHVAEPADAQAMRGRKKHAKTDRTDARLIRDLLHAGELPESWIPPEPVLEWRERTRLYKGLVDQRAVWVQRIHAELYQHGVALPEEHIRSENTRQLLSGTDVELSDAAQQRVRVGYRMIDAVHSEAEALRDQVTWFGRRQKACRARPHLHQQGSPHPGCCRRRDQLRRAPKKRRMPHATASPAHTEHAPVLGPVKVFLLASLRALHLDHPLRSGARRDQGLDAHTPHKKRRS
jgi:hypothetical protein